MISNRKRGLGQILAIKVGKTLEMDPTNRDSALPTKRSWLVGVRKVRVHRSLLSMDIIPNQARNSMEIRVW